MTTDVLFITQTSSYPQMGVLYLVNALEQQNLSSEVVSSSISNEELSAIMDAISPGIVGMSVMTSPDVKDFVRISEYLKENHPDVTVVWGGVHPTLLSEQCLKQSYIDYIFIGQGEEVFPDLVKDIQDGTKKFGRSVQGHTPQDINKYRPAFDKVDISPYLFSETHSVRSPDAKVHEIIHQSTVNIDKIIHGDVSEIASKRLSKAVDDLKKWDVGLYELNKNIFYYLLTSRGCPYRCTFCSEPLGVMHGDSDGKFQWNAHDVNWVKEQVSFVRAELAKIGQELHGIGLWDDMFWVNYRREPRAREILEYFQSEDLGYLIEARADQLLRDDGWLFKQLAETGCIQVFIGAESASQETLNYIRKGTKVVDYYKLMDMAEELKVALRMSFIVGFPNETDESVNATLDICEDINNLKYGPWVNVSGPKIFTPYPGTEECNRAIEAGFNPPQDHQEWGAFHRSTEEYLEHFPWFERNYSDATLERLKALFGDGHKKIKSH